MGLPANGSESLVKFLNELQPFHPGVLSLAEKETFRIAVKKNALIVSPLDNKEDCLFFVVKGVVRGFIVDEEKEITTWVSDENTLIGNIRNPGTNKVTYTEQFQALEDSYLQVLPYSLIDKVYAQFPESNILARKLLAIHFHMSQERSTLSRIPSAEARYMQFKDNHPLLAARVPVKFLATYLGMRIETLSRIRKKSKPEN